MGVQKPYDRNLTFNKFIDEFASSLNVDEEIAKAVYSRFVKIIGKYLQQGKNIYLYNFGVFKLQCLPARTNVTKTGELIHMKDRKIIWFRASANFKKLIYGNTETTNG